MPELLQRLEDASKKLPKMIKKKAVFSVENMVGVLEDWFPGKSSVEIIREFRESSEVGNWKDL